MNRNLQSLLMVAVGGVLLWVTLDGSYLRYVKASLSPWLVASAVALGLVGLILLWADNESKLAARVLDEAELAQRQADRPQPSCGESDDHGHGRIAALVPWLLVLPLLALFVVQPRELGAFTAERAANTQAKPPDAAASHFPPLSGDDPVDVALLDLNQRALYGGKKTLTGRTLVITGFVTPGDEAESGQFYVNRLFVACCAADATPVRARVTGAYRGYQKETWVEVTGRYVGNSNGPVAGADPVPTLEVEAIERIPVPEQPYAS